MCIRTGDTTTLITAINKNVFRVRHFLGKEVPKKVSLCVKPYEEFNNYSVTDNEDLINVSTAEYSLFLNKSTLSVSIKNLKGDIVYNDNGAKLKKIDYTPFDKCIPDEVRENYCKQAIEYKLNFSFDNNEYIYGLGANNCDNLNLRGERIDLIQHNIHLPIPMLVSSKKYGVFFDHYSYMQFNDETNNPFMFVSNCEMADYYIMCGESIDEITGLYRNLVGKAGLIPKYVLGYIQSKERYENQNQLTNTVKKYREINVPIDMIVQDWQYWNENLWGQKSFDKTRFQNPAGLVDELHNMNAKIIISIWPKLEGDSENRREMIENNQLLDLNYYNCFSKVGRQIYYNQLKNGIADYGFDGYWTDDTEPVEPNMHFNIKDNKDLFVKTQMAEFKKMSDERFTNTYTFFHNRSLFENLTKDYPNKRFFLLTRASFPGLSSFNTATWTGDITASFECMKNQIPSIINHSLAGEPFCHNDIGAFFLYTKNSYFLNGRYPRGIKDKEYKELYTRWLQMAAFMPIMRSHGTGFPKEIWQFGKKGTMVYSAIEKYINLRMRLLPYNYSLAYAVVSQDKSFINPLFSCFPDDEKTYAINEQYMFGESIMVCPVTRPIYYKHSFSKLIKNMKTQVYLPKGVNWYDFETNEKYAGGQTIAVNTPIDKIPLFVKEGSIIPMCNNISSTSDDISEISLNIYGNSNANFIFYDDDGVSNENENGLFRKIEMYYKASEKQLIISENQGDYKKDELITFTVNMIESNKKVEAKYYGKELKINL